MKTVQGVPIAEVKARVDAEQCRLIEASRSTAIDNVARTMQTDPTWVAAAARGTA